MPHRTQSKRKAKSSPAARARKDVAVFRESLWKTLARNSAGLSGTEVVNVLKVISAAGASQRKPAQGVAQSAAIIGT
jgi:hypothetical protein